MHRPFAGGTGRFSPVAFAKETTLANPPYGPPQPGGRQQPGPQSPYPPQPQPGYPQPGYPPPAGPRYDNDKGFFGSLFDFSFDNFIAPKLVKFRYVLSLIIITILAIGIVVDGIVRVGQSGGPAVLSLLFIIIAPLVWLIYLVAARLWLEFFIVVFKISDDLKDIRDSRVRR
jgi:hypothetical protein